MEFSWVVLGITMIFEVCLYAWRELEQAEEAEWSRPC